MDIPASLSYLAILIPGTYILNRFVTHLRRPPLPPGPRGLPIIKNLLDWPPTKQWETFTKWAQEYGDIIHLEITGTHIVVLNTLESASALLDAKGSIYSDRFSPYFIGTMVGYKNATTLIDDGPRLKEHRRHIMQSLGSKTAAQRFVPMAENWTCRFLCQLLDDPSSDTIFPRLKEMLGAIVIDATYGYQIKSGEDNMIDLFEEVMRDFAEGIAPGSHLVDLMPWLDRLPSWLPGMGFKKRAEEQRNRLLHFVTVPFTFAKESISTNTARFSMATHILKNEKLSTEQENEAKWATANIYGAGVETTLSALYFFFLFMTRNPDIQAKAQAEIDAVVGHSHLPNITHRSQLPYLEAILSELLRCSSITPLGAPHVVRTDDVYKGCFIPKGSIVQPNIWMMSRDPNNYKDPEVFNPSRFMGSAPELDPRQYVFGFGRRICPGRVFAENNIFLGCAMILATLTISKAVDEEGIEITPPVEHIGDLSLRPAIFPCKITCRSPQAEALLRAATEA